ncbi:MAG: protein kinase [Thermoanaerobaculia bacterium]|nr:protein kinase [Thermoanaerobaculia bacterium]
MPPIEHDSDGATVSRESSPASPAERFSAGQIVAGRYRIVAPLGKGGMGEVYRADDLRLAQTVALKFLPTSLASNAQAVERLVSEVRIGRQVSHPNVCRLYDLVDSEGHHFVSMEFIDGEDLGSLLRRIGRVSSDKALAFARQICAGLAAAHDLGVVHRDLKPANVMVDGRGVARITDFGLAIEGSGGGFAGTPGYMAPEQLESRPATQASDIYALGLVLWEIVTGRRLFDGVTLDELRRQHAAPKGRPSFFASDLDPLVEMLILECLSEAPAERPRSARQLLDSLPGGVSAQLSPSTASARTPKRSSSDRDKATASIAVLPFEDLSGGNDDSFAVGLAEEIIGDLGRIKSLRVIARGSVMRFKGAQSCRPVALELGVAYVLTGSVRKAGNQLRVTANLVEGSSESLVWSEKFKGTLDDIFDIQEQIAKTIAEQLAIELSAGEAAGLAERPIDDPIVYELYLRARDRIWSFSEQGLDRAVFELESGLERAPDNVLLLAALGTAWWQYFNAGIRPVEENLQKAEALAERIFELDPDSHHGHRVLGFVAGARGKVEGALKHLAKVVDRHPTDTEARVWLASMYLLSGLNDLARPHVKRLAEIDPLGALSQWPPIFESWFIGEFESATQLIRKAAEIRGEELVLSTQLWVMCTLARRHEEAALVATLLDRSDESAFFLDLYRFLRSSLEGRRDDALAVVPRLEEGARHDLQYSMQMAEGYAMLGENDTAIEWLENAVDRGFLAGEFLERHDWFFDALRGDVRFTELLDRMTRERDALRASLTAGEGKPER